MAARLLNANLEAAADIAGVIRDEEVGFWCEPGLFNPEGNVPAAFEAAFPIDAAP